MTPTPSDGANQAAAEAPPDDTLWTATYLDALSNEDYAASLPPDWLLVSQASDGSTGAASLTSTDDLSGNQAFANPLPDALPAALPADAAPPPPGGGAAATPDTASGAGAGGSDSSTASLSTTGSSNLVGSTDGATLTQQGTSDDTLSVGQFVLNRISDGSWSTTSAVAPILGNPGDQTTSEGTSVTLALNAYNPSGGALSYDAQNLPPGLSIDQTSGVISGTIPAGAGEGFEAAYNVTVLASNAQGGAAAQQFQWTVTAPVVPQDLLVLTQPPDQTSAPGENVSFNVAVDNQSDLPVTYDAQGLPSGLTIDSAQGIISGTIDAGAVRDTPYDVTLSVSNGSDHASQTFKWTVDAVTVTAPDDQSNVAGDTVSLPVSAVVASDLPPTYSAEGLPPGVSIDATTGVISGTLALDAGAATPYDVTVTANDGLTEDSQGFVWNVQPPVRFDAPADQTKVEGDQVDLALSATPAQPGAVTYEVDRLPPGLSLDSATGVISGTLSGHPGDGQPYTVTATAHAGPFSASHTFYWDVTPAVTLDQPVDQETAVGASVNLEVHATSARGNSPSYSAEHLPPGLSIDPDSGTISGTVDPSAANVTPYAVTVTASDGPYEARQTFSWTVTAIQLTPIDDRANAVGENVNLEVHAQYEGTGTLTYHADHLPPGLEIDPATGQVTGTIADAADANSPYDVTVTASDNTFSDSQEFTWDVTADTQFVSTTTDGNADQQAANDGWTYSDSPFYARNLLEAKYRAYVRAPASPNGDAAPVGQDVADDFGVAATTTWGDFFTTAERQQLRQQRQQAAAQLDPRVLARLDADWRQAAGEGGYTPAASVGTDVAARWQKVPGFDWVSAASGWTELYTVEAYNRLNQLRAQPIPKIDLGKLDARKLSADTDPLVFQKYLLGLMDGSKRVIEYLGSQFRDRVLPVLVYSTPEALGDYVRGLTESERLVLRYALGFTSGQLRASLPDTPVIPLDGDISDAARQAASDAAAQIENAASLAIIQQVYSELSHVDANADYGLQDSNATGVADVVRGIDNQLPTSPYYTPDLSKLNRGTYLQRTAFLADTDFDTYKAREQLDISASRAPEFYFARDQLIHATLYALQHNLDVPSVVGKLLTSPPAEPLYAPIGIDPLAIAQIRATNPIRGDKLAALDQQLRQYWAQQWRDLPPSKISVRNGVIVGQVDTFIANPTATMNKFLYERYLRGAIPTISAQDYYALDRYQAVNMGLPFLAGWDDASEAARAKFADYLDPFDRGVLLDRLARAADQYRATGETVLSEQARQMAVFIRKRFDDQLAALGKTGRPREVFDKVSSARGSMDGIFGDDLAVFRQLPPALQRAARVNGYQAFLEWRAKNPVVVKYEPAFGWEFLDRTFLNMAEFLAPVYRTAERIIGLGQGLATGDYTRTDYFSDIDAIRRVMDGDFSADLRLRDVSYSPGSVIFDGGLTLLTIFPAGGGPRALIGGGRFLMPAGWFFARNQALNALRHTAILGTSMVASSMAMTAVEMSPIEERYKGPLRFVAGLAAGLGTGYGVSRLWRPLEFGIVDLSRKLADATDKLGRAATEAEKAVLRDQIRTFQGKLDQLYQRGGQPLANAERNHAAAKKAVEKLEALANAEGGTPSARAAQRNAARLRDARNELKQAENELQRQYTNVDRLAWEQGILRRPGTAVPSTSGLRILPRPGMTSRTVTAPNGRTLTVWGQAERASSRTPGHPEAMNNLVVRLAATGEYENATIQRSWRTATGRVGTSGKIPDVIGVRRNGVVDAWEVRSATDNPDALRLRLREGMDSLPPERRGLIDVIPPEPPRP